MFYLKKYFGPIKRKLKFYFHLTNFKIRNPKVFLGYGVQFIGVKNIKLGKNVTLSDNLWINANLRDEKLRVIIGSNSHIGRDNFFTVGARLEIGDYFMSSIGCSLISAGHNFEDPLTPYLVSGETVNNSIIIGSNVFIGAYSKVLGNITIGHGVIIGANSFVLDDIPSFSMAVGNPAKVIKRYSFKQKKWVVPEDYNNNDELSEEEFLDMLRKNYKSLPLSYYAASKKTGWI